ncbi:distal tail protein Dit [Lactococcus lactis]|uniref:distal tail protein Dit n=1 Tax=Lactococcus lactis TaxID=1358 RepID=UPI003A80B08C
MTFSVNYNGVELSELVSGFTAIDRGFGSVWNNTLSNQVARYGQSFVKNTLSAKKITITIRKSGIPSDWIALRKELAKVLDVNEPAPLIFGDEPNKVWYAVADGTQALSEDISNLVATGTLTFIVPEGHAYSTYTNVLNSDNSGGVDGSITPNDDGSVDITINNQGTLPTWIDLKLTNNHDNGYFGIAGVNGSLELLDYKSPKDFEKYNS